MVNTTIYSLYSRELNQDITRAKKAAKNVPVFIVRSISVKGKIHFVILSILQK